MSLDTHEETRAPLNAPPWRDGAWRRFVAAALAMQAALLAWSAARHSPINQEVLALPAGLAHWLLGDDALFRATPPLVRGVAALPVLLCEPVVDWADYNRGPGAHAEGEVAEAFIAKNGAAVFWFFWLARLACIPFTLLGGYVAARWAADLYGPATGVVAVTLWTFCPNVLGDGQFVLPDIAAASLAAASLYAFCRWLRARRFGEAVAAGLVLGLAQLTKYLLAALYPIVALVWVASLAGEYRARSRTKAKGERGLAPDAPRWRFASAWGLAFGAVSQMAVLLLIGAAVLNLGYGLAGTGRALGAYTFASAALRGAASPPRALTAHDNRFRGAWLGEIPLPLPEEYVMGIDTLLHDAEKGAVCYLCGRWRSDSPWYFHIYGLALKVPLGTWCLAALALGASLVGAANASRRIEECAVVLAVLVFLALVSFQPMLTNHVRYAMVVLPFVFIWTSKVAILLSRPIARAFVLTCLAWTIASSMFVYPHCVSYFNELAGGPTRGHRYLLGGSLSASQDLYYLERWVVAHPEARPLKLVFYGYGQGKLLGFEYGIPSVSPDGFPLDEERAGAWYAIDVNSILGDRHAIASNLADGYVVPLLDEGDYRYFQRLTPCDRVGYSIWIYHP